MKAKAGSRVAFIGKLDRHIVRLQHTTQRSQSGRSVRVLGFGRGIAQDVATKMLNQFAECLEEEIAGILPGLVGYLEAKQV